MGEKFKGPNSSGIINATYSNDSSPVCMSQEYTGSFCRLTLERLQNCLNDSEELNSSGIYISATIDQKEHAKLVTQLSPFLDQIPPKCADYLIPFSCLYLFPLVNCTEEEAEVIGPGPNQCRLVKENKCPEQWKWVDRIFPGELPDCDSLNEPSINLLDCKAGNNNVACY